jgi:hypothetical protein
MTPYQLVYRKTCYFPVELEHKAFWTIKKWNIDLKVAGNKRKIQIVELEEWRRKPTIVPNYIRKEPKDDTTSESKSNNSSREKRCFFLTLGSFVWSW